MTKWNTVVGDTFISITLLKLLGVSILSPLLVSELFIMDEIRQLPPAHLLYSSSDPLKSYIPCAELAIDPTMRFGYLFLTREYWKAVDTEDLDKLFLLKYARALTDKDGS